MAELKKPDQKTLELKWTGTLNPRPGSVSDSLFKDNSFFDPKDVDAGPIGSFGTNPDFPSTLSDRRVQVSDTLSFVKGRHNPSFGVDYSFVSAAEHAGANQFGSFYIDSMNPRRILQILSGTRGFKLEASAHQAALYAQDSWRITSEFTLSYGLRWEGQFNPSPPTGNSFLMDNTLNYFFPLGRVNPAVIRSQLDQWAPRLNLAWNSDWGARSCEAWLVFITGRHLWPGMLGR